MRTTITIDDSLLDLARRASLERKCTLGNVIEDALRQALASSPKGAKTKRARPLKTFRGSGTLPGVDLSSSAAMAEIMDR